ncbi:WSC2 Glucoamylase III (alpha-14-glucan-glucosidase) [Pyrenophora seminiperda CCB06]|uniref:WSC2 Glucoamylase III (Alpha-14-glucan-glucosidase) n=1 Tax=Pyrenophora seminiperda CCB06 TaxID=1302712 RepID=A0A3M7MC37_9PLEO|nr:WSC2 Glucoamylase III (alpha-14-glucan-glucosidase) [Pyrenophora seminiperda CCB06]
MSLKFVSLALAVVATAASPFDSMQKASNSDPCDPCQPKGASGLTPPAVGTQLSSLYTDILASIQGISFDKRSVHHNTARASGFCCRQSLDCVNVQNLNIPMCYDKFTTNFQFPDGSFGIVSAGEYHSSGGVEVNLVNGSYTKDGQSANIYPNDSEKPNTSTMSIPPQFTGTGVGGAIPITELGSIIVYTTTIPATTYTAATTVAQTVKTATISGHEVETTVPATTISQPTTIAGQTTVVTQTHEASSSNKGAAGQVSVDTTRSFGMSIVGALLYALV